MQRPGFSSLSSQSLIERMMLAVDAAAPPAPKISCLMRCKCFSKRTKNSMKSGKKNQTEIKSVGYKTKPVLLVSVCVTIS